MDAFMRHELYKLLSFLDEECLWYRLDRNPPDAITITVTLAGERLEINVLENGRIEFVRFRGNDHAEGNLAVVARLYERLRPRALH
jgi:hypothetical protein